MMRLALFVPDLCGGGAEKMMVHLANEFSRSFESVDLVVAKKQGPYLTLVNDSVRLVDLGVSFTNPWVLVKLAAYMHREHPTAVLSAMTYPNIAIILARMLSAAKARIVISERVAMGVQASSSRTLKEKLKPLLAKYIYGRADQIVAISNGVADNLAETVGLKREDITTIYNPVVTPLLHRHYPIPDHPYFDDGGPPVILAAGRLVPQKDFKTLLRAFGLLLEITDARLIILGEGWLRKELLELAEHLGVKEHVSLPGYSENPYAYMTHAGLFVLSSVWEGFGNVLVEAMACGCPVVSTNCPSGPAEILEDGRFGLLVPPGNAPELASAMVSTLKKPLDRETLQARAGNFNADKIAVEYLGCMRPN